MNMTDMVVFDIENIGRDYARTLHDWRERFSSMNH